MKHLRSVLLVALTLAIALPTIAQPQRGFKGGGDGPRNIREELKLTDQQEKQMQDLRFDRESKMIDLRAELQTERLMLKKLRLADEPNKKKLYSQIEKAGAVKIKMDKSKVDHQLAVRKVLTKEQFEIFSRNMQRFDGPGEGRRGDNWDKHKNRPHRDRF